jgi:hypothetical protein
MHPATKNFPNPGKQKERQSYLTKPFFAVLPVSMAHYQRNNSSARLDSAIVSYELRELAT